VTQVRVGEIELGYSVDGDGGDWVVMIMGLGYARWGWAWTAPLLARRHRVVTFDNRGVGSSDAPDGPYTAAMMAGDTTGLMDALGIERAHVVGTSLGGFIAQELALAAPERVDKLVLACTAAGGPGMVPMPERTVRLMAEAPSLPDDVRLRRFIENGFSDAFVAAHPDVVERLMEFRRTTAQPLSAWMSQSAAGAAFDASERVRGIEAPTLVITGDSDGVVDPKNSVLLSESIPGARFAELPGGHLFFIEEPERFAAIVEEFLAAP